MRKFARIITPLLAVGLTFGALGMVAAAEDAETIKIGFIGPLTGPNAQSGQAALNGATIAMEEINAAGGLLGKEVEIVPYDDKSSPEESVKSTTRLIEVDHVVGIMGSLHSGNVLAAGPVAEEYQVPVISGGTSPTWLEQGWLYHFRALGNSNLAMTQLAAYCNQAGWKKIAMIHSNDEYGNNGADEFNENAEEKGLEIVADESFTAGDKDFTGQFVKLIASEPDVIMTWGTGSDVGSVLPQLRQAGWGGPIIGPEAYSMPELVDIIGDAFYDVYFATAYIVYDDPADAPSEKMQTFLQNYLDKYGAKPESDNAYRNYDAMYLFANAITEADSTDGTAIRDALEATQGFEGLAGTFNFTGNHGEGIDSVRIFQVDVGGVYTEIPME